MDPKTIKVLSEFEVKQALGQTKYLPIAVEKDYYKELKTNLLSPSTFQNYSCCIEFITSWFYNKFPKGFFKQTYMDLQHIFSYRLHHTFRQMLVNNKPAAAIKVSIDPTYNREFIDSTPYGAMLYNNKSRYKDSFFRDMDRHLYISMQMEMLKLNFTFKMLVPEQGIQMDLAKKCELVFRCGFTQKHYADVDFHIPDELLMQVAEDTNNYVCPCSGRIVEAEKFVNYFNMHSSLALYYKFDASKGKMQYFLKVPHCYIHIRSGNIQLDEGQLTSNITNNYNVSFDAEVLFPSPKFYAYYSMKTRQNKLTMSRLDEKSFGIMASSLARVPYKNERGWQWSLETQYTFPDDQVQDIKDKKLMKIDFHELIGDLRDVIESTKSMAISPDVFLDIDVYCKFRKIDTTTDWWNYTINFNEPCPSTTCYLIIYMDNAYFHNMLNVLHEYDKQRIQTDDSIIEHKRLDDYKKNLKRTSMGRPQDKVVVKEEYTS